MKEREKSYISQWHICISLEVLGSGKSTLLNVLGILDQYDAGEYRLDGNLIKNLSQKRAAQYRNKLLGFVFQSFNLLARTSALRNVMLPLVYNRQQPLSQAERADKAMAALTAEGPDEPCSVKELQVSLTESCCFC